MFFNDYYICSLLNPETQEEKFWVEFVFINSFGVKLVGESYTSEIEGQVYDLADQVLPYIEEGFSWSEIAVMFKFPSIALKRDLYQ